MAYSKAIKTQAGEELLSRVMAGESTIMFSKLAISDTPIDSFVAKQEIVPMATKFTRDNKVGVLLNGVFSNASLTTGYDVNTIAMYAKDSSNVEILFAYLYAIDDSIPMSAFDGNVPQSINLQIESGIYLDDDSMIIIDPSGIATIEYVDSKLDNKLDKKTTAGGSFAYTHNGTTQGEIAISGADTANTIMYRNANGYSGIVTPVGQNNNAIVNKGSLNRVTEVTVPYTGWTHNTTTGLYEISITVSNMYDSYVGTQDVCPKILRGNYISTIEKIEEQFSHIKNIVSNNGSITIYADEIPSNGSDPYANLILLLYGL